MKIRTSLVKCISVYRSIVKCAFMKIWVLWYLCCDDLMHWVVFIIRVLITNTQLGQAIWYVRTMVWLSFVDIIKSFCQGASSDKNKNTIGKSFVISYYTNKKCLIFRFHRKYNFKHIFFIKKLNKNPTWSCLGNIVNILWVNFAFD